MDFSRYRKSGGSCESCEFYEYDESSDTYGCRLSLDEDERADFLARNTAACPYYRYYDEYTSVRRQI